MKSVYKVAAVQASPVFLDLEATTDKACRIIDEAASNGAEIIAMPEAFFPGYPYWTWIGDPSWGMQFYKRYYENAVTIPGPTISKISDAARRNNVYVCISVTEKDRASLYLSQLWFDRKGNLMGKHRKIRPTLVERTIWGDGDGSMMQVYDTELGMLGGLQCWEHLMSVNPLIMASMNEQVHVAAYPAFTWDERSINHYECCRTCCKYYAMTTGTFVLLTSEVLSEKTIDIICGDDEYKRSIYKPGYGAGAQIINPSGITISNVVPVHEEGIAYADIDLNEIIEVKYKIDTAGHYSRGDIATIHFDRTPHNAVSVHGDKVDYSIPYDKLHANNTK